MIKNNKKRTGEIAKAIALINSTPAEAKDDIIAMECKRIGVKQILIRSILRD